MPMLASTARCGPNELRDAQGHGERRGRDARGRRASRTCTTYDSDTRRRARHPRDGHRAHGRDPKTSVLNGATRCTTCPNVFVTDGSCMASSACQNPSLTYMALTARAVDHAVNELKRMNI